jgi:hypothetical protein
MTFTLLPAVTDLVGGITSEHEARAFRDWEIVFVARCSELCKYQGL